MIGSAQPGVAHVVLSLGRGGTERLVIEMTRRMTDAVRVVICLDGPGVWADEVTRLGVRVIGLHRRPGFRPALGLKIARMARAFDASVLHCHHYSPFVYGRLAVAASPRLRLVYTEHGRLSDAPPSAKRRLVNPLLSRFRGTIHAVSHDLRRHMIASGFPAARIRVIHNGIEPGPPVTTADVNQARSRLGVAPGALVLGTAARLDPVKDIGTMLTAVSIARQEWPALTMWVIGDGPDRRYLEEMSAALGLHEAVRFAGMRDDVRQLLPALNVYVNSSLSEGISLTLLEAMAASLPVVATDVGGTPEVVERDRTGVLVPPRSPQALAVSIGRLLASEPLRRSMGDAGRQRADSDFSLERMTGEYASVYRSVGTL